MDIDPSELKNAVERMHHCSARLIQSVPIREWFEHETVWESAVHIFDLEGHPTASSSLLKNLNSSAFVLRFSSSYKRSVRFGSECSRLVATLSL
jgi:hypothetical protein